MLMFNWFAPKVFNQGYLPEEDGHQVFFMEAGSKDGKPVLVFHGGPGGASRLRHAEAFDRRKFRVVFFDQRGCGRSQPSGETAHNTTADLLHDAARLLDFLDIKEKVILLGGSWGATLALLFAEKYPERVKALLLSKIFLADEISAGWTDDVSGWFYPDVMDKLRRNMPENANLPEYYAEMVNSRNLSDQVKAASLYGNYERVLGQLVPVFEKKEVTQDNVNAARILINYAAAGFMLKDDQIMSNVERIRELPALIVHNRLDMVCPLIGAWRLHKALPASKLVIVPEKGHVGPLMARTLKKEIRRFLKI